MVKKDMVVNASNDCRSCTKRKVCKYMESFVEYRKNLLSFSKPEVIQVGFYCKEYQEPSITTRKMHKDDVFLK